MVQRDYECFKDVCAFKKGSTTIPAEIRAKLNLKEGDLLVFECKDTGEVTLRKAPSSEEREYLKGIEQSFAVEWMGADDDL